MEIRPVQDDELDDVARWLAHQQADPTRHIAYLAMDAEAIATGLRELEPDGLGDALVAVDGEVVGFLAAEHDRDPPRVWWHGPFVAADRPFDTVADALYAAAKARLPAHVSEEELGPDDRHADVAAFAGRHGFAGEEPSAVLVRALGGADDPDRRQAGATPAAIDLGDIDATTATAVAELHDTVFRGTHTPGRTLADPGDDQRVVVARRGGDVVGYIAVERQEDGSGYIDYLGVRHDARRDGLGRALVAAGSARLRDELSCPSVHLTVRASNAGARRLYEQVGFEEERLIRPWRRGFSLAHLDTPPS